MEEIWKYIKGYEGYYQASNNGRIRSVDRTVVKKDPQFGYVKHYYKGRVLSLMINKGTRNGVKPRYQIRLSKDGIINSYQVHRLIAETFIGPIDGKEINHKNGDCLDNNIDNIEIVNRLDNIRHAFENKLINTSYSVLKLDPKTKDVIEEFYSVSQASRTIPISQGSLRFHLEKKDENLIYKGYCWKYK